MTTAIIFETTNGYPFIVDKEDAEFVSQRRWSANWAAHQKTYYIRELDGEREALHRILLNAPEELWVDHKNSQGFDNRRFNIRLATGAQNVRNVHKAIMRGGKPVASKYKGVRKLQNKHSVSWMAHIQLNKVREYLGSYATEEEAAIVYDKRAKELFGEFAKLNFPDGPPELPILPIEMTPKSIGAYAAWQQRKTTVSEAA